MYSDTVAGIIKASSVFASPHRKMNFIKRTLCALMWSTLFGLSVTSAQNQGEMNLTASKDFVDSDTKLNQVYAKMLATLDDEGKEKLRVSERAWLVYREAQAKFLADAVARGDSMSPQIYNECRVTLTQARITELKQVMSVNTESIR